MIQILCADISGADENTFRALYEKASPQRRQRADGYRRREDALRCLAGEALLRHVLGTGQFTVEKAENGKPFLSGREDFHFNLSHADHWVVLAWGGTPVGVDVEKIRPDTDIAAVSRRFFHPQEQRSIREAPDMGRRFFEIWTAKESYLKYLGTGLKTDLRSFSVMSLPPQLHLHQRSLKGDCVLSLCAEDESCTLEQLPVQALLSI